jgi:hypothetical protein
MAHCGQFRWITEQRMIQRLRVRRALRGLSVNSVCAITKETMPKGRASVWICGRTCARSIETSYDLKNKNNSVTTESLPIDNDMWLCQYFIHIREGSCSCRTSTMTRVVLTTVR